MPIGKLRAALLASAALTALCLPPAQPALAGPDRCSANFTTHIIVCSGDQSDGIAFYNQREITVRNLSGDITPAEGVVGVLLLNAPYDGAIITEASPYGSGITTMGDGTEGINVGITYGRVRVENSFRITTTGSLSDAIRATAFVGAGPAEVVNNGELTTNGDDSRGIFVEMGVRYGTLETVNASVENHAAITTRGARSHGIAATALDSNATVTNDARITVTGDDAYGLYANAGGDVARVVNSGPIMMTGQATRAIVARGNNTGDVQNDGPLTLNSANSYGIDAQVSGPVLVTSTGDINASAGGTIGIFAASTGQGAATIVNSGDVSTSGGASRGLWASAANGDAYVRNDGIIRNTGPGESLGIGAFANTGSVNVKNYGTVSTAGGHAIMATSFYGDIDITNDASLTAGRDGIYAAVFRNGGAKIVNSGEISGDTGGIRVNTSGGDVAIDNRAHVSTSGDSAIEAISQDALATVENQGTVDSAGRGIFAFGNAGAVVRNHGSVTVTGDSEPAISANSGSSDAVARVENDGTVVSMGNFSDAIAARSRAGMAEVVNRGDLATTGTRSRGISAAAANGVSVENHAAVTTHGDYGDAISASVTRNGDVDVVNTSDLTTTGQMAGGIIAEVGTVAEPGSASIYNSGNISIAQSAPGQSSAAIAARVIRGDIGIKNYNALHTGAGGIGISAASASEGNITINSDSARADGTGGITADFAGIQAVTGTGDISVLSIGDVTAGNRGIDVYTRRGGNISVKSYGTILSDDGSAIVAIAAGPGSVTIHNTGDLTARQDGINGITRNGDATIVNAGAITMVGDYARAIHLEAYGSQGVATLTSVGRLSAVGLYSRGIAAEAHDGVALNVESQGDVQVVGTGAYGVRLTSVGGNVSLTSRGPITAEGGFNYGIAVGSGGADAAVVSEGDIRILGQYGRGIVANGVNARTGSSGNLELDGKGAIGILASANVQSATGDPGLARITSAGAVTMTGADAVALKAESRFGDAEIVVADGTVTGGSGPGSAGVELSAAGAARLENHGIIQSLNDRAIINDPGSGPATIDNLNTIIGSIDLDDGEDSLVNRGLFEARGDSDFGSGIDSMVNSGTLHVSDSGGADQVTILGLESFTNGSTGLIAMVDGRTGDRLTLPALDAFNGGGVIALDAALAGTGAPADLLTVSGVVSGTTLVVVNNVARSPGIRGADDIFVIDQGSRPRGDEFRQLTVL